MREPLADRVYRALLRLLPFDFRGDFGPEMEEVFREQRTFASGPAAIFGLWLETAFSVGEIEDFRKKNRTLSALAEYHSMNFTLFEPNSTERVRTGIVSADFFDIFGMTPILGRKFTQADDEP